jgi:hypothetical protein
MNYPWGWFLFVFKEGKGGQCEGVKVWRCGGVEVWRKAEDRKEACSGQSGKGGMAVKVCHKNTAA